MIIFKKIDRVITAPLYFVVYYTTYHCEMCLCMQKCIIFMQQGKSEGFESCDRPIVRKRPIWVKIGDVLSRVTLKFDE